MGELNEGLSPLYTIRFLVPAPFSIPFTAKYKNLHSPLLHANAGYVRYLSVPRRRWPAITKRNLLRNVQTQIAGIKPDLIHLHWAYPEILLLPELKKLHLPLFISFHGFMFYDVYKNSGLRPYLEKAIESADRIFAVGHTLKHDISAAFPEHADKVFCVYNGINETKFSPGSKTEALKKSGFEPEYVHVLCAANIAREKGVDVLVNAVAGAGEFKNIRFHLLGRIIDHRMMAEINKVIENNPYKNIEFHGPVPHDRLVHYYRSADIFVLPSRKEGFGVALVEAGMCGLPLLSTRSGGPEDIITHETGLLCTAGDTADLRVKLSRLLQNTDNYSPEIIRDIMIKQFSQKNTALLISKHYDEFIK